MVKPKNSPGGAAQRTANKSKIRQDIEEILASSMSDKKKTAAIIGKAKELGFTTVTGFGNYEPEALGNQVAQLADLDARFNAIAESGLHTFKSSTAKRYSGAVSATDKYLVLSSAWQKNMSSIIGDYEREHVKTRSAYVFNANGNMIEIDAAFSMPIADTRYNKAAYTVTHEYGHILHNALTAKAGLSMLSRSTVTNQARNEIISIATSKYGFDVDKPGPNLSRYSYKNSKEFFAEAFANSQLGAPTAIGKAMNDWLKQNGY